MDNLESLKEKEKKLITRISLSISIFCFSGLLSNLLNRELQNFEVPIIEYLLFGAAIGSFIELFLSLYEKAKIKKEISTFEKE